MMKHRSPALPPRSPGKQAGFALLEALLAILIFSIGILSLIGMQAAATRYTTDAQLRSMASFFANQRLAEIWLNKAQVTTYVEAGTNLADLPNGKRIVTVDGDAQKGYLVQVQVNWKLPGETSQHQVLMQTTIHDRCDNTTCT